MLPITNRYVFPKVMNNPEVICRFLKVVLKDQGYSFINDITAENISVEKEFIRVKKKDTRLDVYIRTLERDAINIEMQNQNKEEEHLPKRSRFYHAGISIDQLEKSEKYKDLKSSTVIFLCMFDYFGQNLPVYTFRMKCEENRDLYLQDGMCTIILNLTYDGELLTDDMRDIYRYFREGVPADDNELIRLMDEAVLYVNEKEGANIMTYEEDRIEDLELLAEKIAKNFLRMGDSVEKVAECTGVAPERVEELKIEVETGVRVL